MQEIVTAFGQAVSLVIAADPDIVEIVALSLRVTLSAVVIACAIGLPLGAFLAVCAFPGRTIAVIAVNALMGLPPVVVGLFVYLMLSNAGPFGVLQLLYTPGGNYHNELVGHLFCSANKKQNRQTRCYNSDYHRQHYLASHPPTHPPKHTTHTRANIFFACSFILIKSQ